MDGGENQRIPIAGIPKLVWVFCAWTLLIWVQRVRNVFDDESLVGSEVGKSLVLPVVFVVLGGAVLAVALSKPRRSVLKSVIQAAGVVVTGIWVVRAAMIATADHEAAFIAVHTVLAIVSIGLVWAAFKSVPAEPVVKGEVLDGVGSK